MVSNGIKFALARWRLKNEILYVTNRITNNYIYDPRKEIATAIKKQDKDFIIYILELKKLKPEILEDGKIIVYNSKNLKLEPIITYSLNSVEIKVDKTKIVIKEYKDLKTSLIEFLNATKFKDNKDCKDKTLEFISKF